MAKLIYASKIYLFHHQRAVRLTKKEEMQLARFVQFGALVYTNAWLSAPRAVEAPTNDLQLWKVLKRYQLTDPETSAAARKVLENHLWYLFY